MVRWGFRRCREFRGAYRPSGQVPWVRGGMAHNSSSNGGALKFLSKEPKANLVPGSPSPCLEPNWFCWRGRHPQYEGIGEDDWCPCWPWGHQLSQYCWGRTIPATSSRGCARAVGRWCNPLLAYWSLRLIFMFFHIFFICFYSRLSFICLFCWESPSCGDWTMV